MLHTIRQIVGDDARWRDILRGLNSTFRHQTVTGQQVEDYIGSRAGRDLSKVFQQYLTTTLIPVLEYRIDGRTLSYRWAGVVPGFDMPVRVTLSDGAALMLQPTERWQTKKVRLEKPADFAVDPNYYVTAREVAAAGQ
jgi:aminopeptidase N